MGVRSQLSETPCDCIDVDAEPFIAIAPDPLFAGLSARPQGAEALVTPLSCC
jgi:hypothetical protein